MIPIATFFYKVNFKFRRWYAKRLFRERTGADVSDTVFQGHVKLLNPNVKLGKRVYFRGDCIFDGNGPIEIGDDVRINHGVIIRATKGGGVKIGDKTGIAPNVYIIDMDHGTAAGNDYHAQPDSVEKVIIGKNVWIAQDCTILKGSIIGDNAICAAKSVVTGKTIPENAIAAGVPAKVIKYKEVRKEDE